MMMRLAINRMIAIAAPRGQFNSCKYSSYTMVAAIFNRLPPSRPGIAKELALNPNTIKLPESMPGSI